MEMTETRRWRFKGPEMEGPIARWYARIRGSASQLEAYRKQALHLTTGLRDGARVLEVAPGPGYLAIEMARPGRIHVTGLDISRTFVEIAGENASQAGVTVEFRQGDVARMPFETESFDLVVCQAAFKNFTQPRSALAEMHRVLRAGGSAVIQDMSRAATHADSLLYAVLLITSARLGDIYGPRNLFAVGVVIFTIASGFSALAQDPTQLIVSRALQGLGAAVLAPQGLPLMMSLFPVDRRGGVFAIYGVIAGLAVVAGPTVGGYLVTHFGWRSIFTVNIPVGVITFALAMLVIPDLRPGRRHRLDLFGVALATAGLLGVIFGLIEGQRYEWGTVTGFVTIPEIIGAGIVLLALFLYYQARRQSAVPL